MSYPESGYQCHRCMMRFAVVRSFPNNGEINRCPTPGCYKRFWHGYCGETNVAAQTVHCEMLQTDLEA